MKIGVCALFRAVAFLSAFGLSAPAFAVSPQVISAVDPAQGPPAGGNGDSAAPLLTPDGRFVLFASTAKNLAFAGTNVMPGGIPARYDVFLRDRTSGSTALVSVNRAGTGGGNGDSLPAGISANGRYALFESSASDLVAGDTNNVADVFVRDLVSGTTVLVSRSTNGGFANGACRGSAMTPDGRYVAFVSEANNLVPRDTNGLADVFVRDLETGDMTLVSVGAKSTGTTTLPAGSSEAPVITPDGRFVAFYSTATNLVPGVRLTGDVYLRDLAAGTTVWVSTGARQAALSALRTTNVASYNHALSDDGQYVAFEASPLSGTTSAGLILRFDVLGGQTEVVHTNAAVNTYVYEEAQSLDMTPDGRFVAFAANTNGTTGATTCLLVWDGQTTALSLASGDLTGAVRSGATADLPSLSPDGRYVAFVGSGANLTTNNLLGGYDVFVRDLQAGVTVLADADTNGVGSGVSPTSLPRLTADGRYVAFEAFDDALVAGDRNKALDVFVRDLANSATELISAHDPALASQTASGVSSAPTLAISADGRLVAFCSDASDLGGSDTNSTRDVYVRDLVAGTNLLVSVATNGFAGDGFSTDPGMSGDGRYVVFTSSSDNLVPLDSNNASDVFVRDLQAGTTTLVSVSRTGTGPGDKESYSPAISLDGRYVMFRSKATTLTASSVTGTENLFVRDLQAGVTYALTTAGVSGIASMTPAGQFVTFADMVGSAMGKLYIWSSQSASRIYTNGSLGLLNAALSPDGNRLVFWAGSGVVSLFAVDFAAKTNWAIASSLFPASRPGLKFSADGRLVTYVGVTGVGTVTNQVYFYDFLAKTNRLISRAYGTGAPANSSSDSPAMSPDGRFVAYRSAASDLVPGDTNGVPDIFLYDCLSGATLLMTSSRFGNWSANDRSLTPWFSEDGMNLVFGSWATDLAPGDFNGSEDIFAVRLYPGGEFPVFSVRVAPAGAPGQRPVLTWPVVSGRSYRVQFKRSLADPDWQEAYGGMTVVGSQGYFSEPAVEGQRFYRVVGF